MAQMQRKPKPARPAQRQRRQPGLQSRMRPQPETAARTSPGDLKFRGKVALISGGDSGIGRAVAVAFSAEGADIAILYRNEHADARKTRHLVEENGTRCILMAGDVGTERFCRKAVHKR